MQLPPQKLPVWQYMTCKSVLVTSKSALLATHSGYFTSVASEMSAQKDANGKMRVAIVDEKACFCTKK